LEIKVNGNRVLDTWRNLPKPELEIENTNTTLKRNETHVSLISGQGIEVVLSVEDLQVNVSQRHWNTTCGLCGNNDGEMDSEFRTPWTSKPTHVTNTTKFGLSWMVQGKDCMDPECELKKFASLPINMITDEPVMIGDKKAACFSTEPVFYCPKDCTPVPREEVFAYSTYVPEKISVEVGFHCLRASDTAKQYSLMKDLTFGNKIVDLIKEIEIPQKCHCIDTCLQSKTKW